MGLLKVAIDRLLTTDPAGWLGHKLTEPQDPMPETIGEAMDMVRTNAKMAIDSATEQLQAKLAKHRWIPVEERLPKLVDGGCQSEWVDATNGIKKHEGYYYDYTGRQPMSGAATGKGWCCHGIGKVTHWKPIILPEGE